jgi:hypothetical protein
MSGIRSPEDILKSFEGLDRVPGSKQKRRESTPMADKRRKQAMGESNGWDANPIQKTLQGKVVDVFPISALANALEKKIVTIRHWESKGYIPAAPYRLRSKNLNGAKVNGNRVYTRELIEIVIEEFSVRGLLGSARVEWNQHESLTNAITQRWKENMQQQRES